MKKAPSLTPAKTFDKWHKPSEVKFFAYFLPAFFRRKLGKELASRVSANY